MHNGFSPDEYPKLPADKDLYVVCYGGLSSRTAIYALKQLGIANPIYNVAGGMDAWRQKYPEVIPVGGISVEEITPAMLKALLDSGKKCIILDVRGQDSYNAGHIPGAKSAEFHAIVEGKEKFDMNAHIITYCGGTSCHISQRAAESLIKQGYKKVQFLNGGYPAWVSAGYLTHD